MPRGGASLVRRLAAPVHELDVDQELDVGSVSVKAVHAEHDSARLLGKKTDAFGYVVSGTKKIYFLGDTDLFPALADAAPDADVALIPIWGWGPSLGTGHLDPRRAAEAVALIRPRIAVPIHWGTYYPVTVRKSARDFLRAPVGEFADAAAELAPAVDVRILPVGGTLEL
jgi:L-ascorbate metabolism protein UlaG (beta-lactamase superfamily)